MIRILLVDDHAVVREGVKRILATAADIEVAGEAADVDEAYAVLAATPYDLVLLDISLPQHNGFDVLKHLQEAYPSLPVLIFSVHPERQYVVRALKAGTAGYLLKNSPPGELLIAVRHVAQGERYFSGALLEHLVHEITETDKPLHTFLSLRETQVLGLLATGSALKEIAYELHLSVKTVSTYRLRVLKKLGLHTTAELIRYALQHRLVE